MKCGLAEELVVPRTVPGLKCMLDAFDGDSNCQNDNCDDDDYDGNDDDNDDDDHITRLP